MQSKFEKEGMSADRLEAYLRKHGHSASHVLGTEPPDFFFEVDGKKWAVEITELHQFDVNGIAFPATAALADAISNLVRSEIRARGVVLEKTIFIHLERHISRLEMNSIAEKVIAAIPFAGPQAHSCVFKGDGSVYLTTGGKENPVIQVLSLTGTDDIESQRKPVEKAIREKVPILRSIGKADASIELVLLLEVSQTYFDNIEAISEVIRDIGINTIDVRIFYSGWKGIREVVPVQISRV